MCLPFLILQKRGPPYQEVQSVDCTYDSSKEPQTTVLTISRLIKGPGATNGSDLIAMRPTYITIAMSIGLQHTHYHIMMAAACCSSQFHQMSQHLDHVYNSKPLFNLFAKVYLYKI